MAVAIDKEYLSVLLKRPEVKVSVVVAYFRGKLLGTIDDQLCSFATSCLIPDCPKSQETPLEIKRLAILVPPYPAKRVTQANIRKCYCRIYEANAVDYNPKD